MFCGYAGHLDDFCFRCKRLERWQREYLRNAYHENIDFSPHFAPCATPRSNHHSDDYRPRENGHAPPRTNHHSYGYGLRENDFVSQCFSFDPRSLHHGDQYMCRHRYPSDGFYSHHEPRCFDRPCLPHCGSCSPRSSDDVHVATLTSSCCMVKCWIPKVYLTNPTTKPSISLSCDM